MLPRILIGLSAIVILALGVIHLLYTFWGAKLQPRDAELQTAMMSVSPVITTETTMWKAWIGFNASHSMGAILFGLTYAYLAFYQPIVLFESIFLVLVGFAMLAGLSLLGSRYWFSIPFRGITFSLACYCFGISLYLFA
jgi:hypothetical protein